MVETVYDLCKPSMFKTTFPAKPGSSFFFPLGILSLCDRKHESDQNPRATLTQTICLWGALGKTSGVTAPIVIDALVSANLHRDASIVRS